MSEFNLIDEPWIPVLFRNGRRAELGIRDTLLQSKEISGIEDQSPLVVAALHRLLLAVLYRALKGPTDIEEARALFRDRIPVVKVTDYLTSWHSRFWLFDKDAPFWQVSAYSPKEWRAWTVLAAEHNADNAKVLFDHINIESAGSVSNAAAARWLAAVQTFAVSSGKSELAHTSGAPSPKCLMAIPLGVNLEETLILALVPQNRAVTAADHAVWERPSESLAILKAGHGRRADGIADLYTWRSRTIRLLPAQGGVAKVAFASGIAYMAGALSDPMTPFRIDDKFGRLAIQLRDRGLWRDFDSLLPDGADLAPAVMSHASVLTHRDPARRPQAVTVIGQATDQAKIEFWRAERFALPTAIANDGVARAQLTLLLADAENAQRALWSACQSYARDVIARGTRVPAKQDLTAFVRQMDVTPRYWSFLEARFHELLAGYTARREFEELRAQWLSSIRDAIEQSWRTHASSVSLGDAWAIRALVRAEGAVAKGIRNLIAEIAQLNQVEIVA